MHLIESFYGTPRPMQISILKEIEEAISNGYNDILLNAPTGVGKSYIALALALAYGSSSILTATLDLQEQYSRDFPFIRTIKGRRNFRCLKTLDKVTCDKVPSNLCYNSSEGFCSYYPRQEDFEVADKGVKERIKYRGDLESLCEYYYQKHAALASSHTVFNYHEYLSLLKFTQQAPYRSVMICDEAHLLENRLVEFYGLTIGRRLLLEAGMSFPSKRTFDIEFWLSFITQLRDNYNSIADEMQNRLKKRDDPEIRESLSKAEANLERLEFIIDEIESSRDNYVVTIEGKEISKVTLLPIDVSRHASELLRQARVRLFMSATLDFKGFCRSMNLEEDKCKFIERGSPFPVENRRVYFLDRYTLNRQNANNDRVLGIISSSIDEIMNKHKDERGLILTTSYSMINSIKERISAENRKRLLITNDVDRDKIVSMHERRKDSVILSPSLWDGIDLRDEYCRFIIITKAPYLDLSDRRVYVKMARDIDWYTMQSAMRLVQGCGRGVRHDNDWCRIYVLDRNASNLLQRVKHRIPSWFIEACVFNSSTLQRHLES